MKRLGIALLLFAAPLAFAADRSHPPTPGPPRAVRLPQIQSRTLANGLSVLLVEQHELPTVFVDLVIRAGAAADPADRPGLASMTADMLDEGAGSRDALALADSLDVLGAELGTGAAWDSSAVSLHVPVKRLAEALPLMADVALHPTFPPAELERLRRESLTSLLQLRDDPDSLASIAVTQAVFDGHRYGHTATAATIGAITLADVQRFYARHYQPANATLIVVGDITPSVMTLVESAFGAWPRGGEPAAPLPEPKPLHGRTIWLIDRPDAQQSTIRMGRVGPPRAVAEYPAIEVMDAILGGMFTSRLNLNLRETHQYAYGAGSSFVFHRVAGSFRASADVHTPSTADSVREMLKELTRIRSSVSPEEVERARSYLAMSYPGEFETPGQIAGRIAERIVYGLPEDTFEAYVPRLLKVTAADVKRAAEKTIDPAHLVIVIVGDRAKIEAPLRALHLGDIRIVTPDDILGPTPKLE